MSHPARNRVLVYTGHPKSYPSTINAALEKVARSTPGVTVVDIEEEFAPCHYLLSEDQIHAQQRLMEAHDVIVWQFPVHWYSSPPGFRSFIDQVLEAGWAYGCASRRSHLAGKKLVVAISFVATTEEQSTLSITPQGVAQPFYTTGEFCGMQSLPVFITNGSSDLQERCSAYGKLLRELVSE